jgi:hypothetical protein
MQKRSRASKMGAVATVVLLCRYMGKAFFDEQFRVRPAQKGAVNVRVDPGANEATNEKPATRRWAESKMVGVDKSRSNPGSCWVEFAASTKTCAFGLE